MSSIFMESDVMNECLIVFDQSELLSKLRLKEEKDSFVRTSRPPPDVFLETTSLMFRVPSHL